MNREYGENEMKTLLIAALFASQAAFADRIAELYPVAENVRGHENIEWSISYAYHFTDAKKDLPRVLLVGDSICQGYQGKVCGKLDGKVNVTYWASSYCVTSPGYLRLLAFYLDEAKYDVIHFNNGLHSCETPVADYEKSYRAALQLVKAKQPAARIVWASSTPLNTGDAAKAGKVAQLNDAARRAVRAVGDIGENDLFALLNPLERSAYWVDTHHYSNAGYELIASQVVKKVTAAVSLGTKSGLAGERSYASVTDGGAALWKDEPAMWCVPKTYETNEPNPEGVRSVVIEGEMYKGARTRFFAWWALPKGASSTNRVPGIVLVHGGDGTAFSSWVKSWADRGYAAIAMDTCGAFPKSEPALGGWLRHAYSGPTGWGRMSLADDPPKDQWPYHAVATVIRSHSFLRSLPEVDPDRIGLTGISWGGYLTACTAGIDSRFAFAVPVYGCAFLKDHSVWSAQFAGLGEKGVRWDELWDARNFLPSAKMPILWVTGSNDHFFPLDSLQRGYDLLPKAPRLAVRVRMPHGHPPAGDPAEIRAFADHFAFGKPAFPEFSTALDGRRLSVKWNGFGRRAVRAELVFTASSDEVWEKRVYETLPVPFANDMLSVDVPKDATVFWVNVTFDDGIVASTRHW